jgi:tol-pal system protein YbgF
VKRGAGRKPFGVSSGCVTVFVGLLIVLSGCATRGSVQRFSDEMAALKSTVEKTSRDMAQVASMLKESEARLGEQARGVEALGQRIDRFERLDVKFREFEGMLKDVKASVEALRPRGAKLPGRVPPDSAEKVYAAAQGYYQSGNIGQAVLEFTDLLQHFPKHPLAENAQYWIGAAYLSHHDFRQALLEFRKVLDQYPGGRKMPDALYQLGVCYRDLFEPQRGRQMWLQLIRDFPESDAARLARTAMRARGASRPAK